MKTKAFIYGLLIVVFIMTIIACSGSDENNIQEETHIHDWGAWV